jgi:hypothetical protein
MYMFKEIEIISISASFPFFFIPFPDGVGVFYARYVGIIQRLFDRLYNLESQLATSFLRSPNVKNAR